MRTDLGPQLRELIDRGARPVSLEEISRRQVPAARRDAGRRRTLITVAACGVAAAGCAAGFAVAFSSHSPRPGAPARAITPASRPSQGPAFLTAVTLKRVASASQAALGNSGREQISYRSVKNGTVDSAGTDTVTYSGSDYNYAVGQTVPAGVNGIVRVVHGQFYLLGQPGTPWLHMFHKNLGPTFPEAATLVRLLSPAANFQDAGTEVIGGVRLTHLHATRLSGLPGDPTLARYANLVSGAKSGVLPPGTLTGLDVWVDSQDVVHQMKIQLEGGDGQTTLTVTFTDSGQPQSITTPASSVPSSG